MYAEIHAVTEEDEDSPGKTSWVNTDQFELSIGTPPASHLGDPKKFLELKAETSLLDRHGRAWWRRPHYSAKPDYSATRTGS